jgi:hypothetical protein
MAYTTPTDYVDGVVVTAARINQDLGATGNIAYLKGVTDAPMKAQGDAGTIYGGRAKINFISGAGTVVTVADDGGNDRVNVTLAASGGITPTQGTDYGSVTLTDPGSYPGWGSYQDLIASTAYAAFYIKVLFYTDVRIVSQYMIGIGTSLSDKIIIPVIGYTQVTERELIPFNVPAGSHVGVKGYFTGAGSPAFAIVLLG